MLRLEASGATVNQTFGQRWLTEATPFLDLAVDNVVQIWICNLTPAFNAYPGHRFCGGAQCVAQTSAEVGTYLEWHPFALFGKPAADDDSRSLWQLYVPHNASKLLPGADILVAVDFAGPLICAPYSLGPGITGAHELEIASGFTCGSSWTIAFTAQWPQTSPPGIGNQTFTIATLFEDADNYVLLTLAHTSITASTITADFVVAGSSLGTVALTCDVQPGQLFDILVSNTGSAQLLAARRHGISRVSNTGAIAGVTIAPVAVRFSSADQATVHSVNPIRVNVIDDAAYDATQASTWMQTHLFARSFAVPSSAGVFGGVIR
jgi:hypothetical protein